MSEALSFADLPLPETLKRALEQKGLTDPTPVQTAIVGTDASRDLLVSSRTGSGKTVAFGLATLPSLLREDGRVREKAGLPQLLVIAPTRELAQQVARELTWLGQSAGLVITTCVGGVDPRRESRTLQMGTHVVVGTPGRLCDHLNRGALELEGLKAVVLDEADEMLDMGFREELETLLNATPAERRTLLFSATLPPETVSLARRYTKDPASIAITSASQSHEDIEHVVHLIDPSDRERAVVNVLRQHEAASALVFCQTREGASRLAVGLLERGFHAVAFSGDLSQPERQRALQSVRDGRTRVLVCTDVAARGLDLPAVGLVIHADPATDTASLMHRSGRTGRAGKKGTAVALVPFHRGRSIERVYRGAKIALKPTPAPTPEDVAALDEARLRDRLRMRLEEIDPADLERAADLLSLATPEQLAALWLREQRQDLPAVEPLNAGRAERKKRERPVAVDDAADGERRPVFNPDADIDNVDRDSAVWFEINIGREQRADPKWLIPLLCRRGDIEKRHIGRIVIGPNVSRVEIHPDAAEDFALKSAQPDEKDPLITILPAVGDARDMRNVFEDNGPRHKRRPPPRQGPGRPFNDGPRRYNDDGPRRPFTPRGRFDGPPGGDGGFRGDGPQRPRKGPAKPHRKGPRPAR